MIDVLKKENPLSPRADFFVGKKWKNSNESKKYVFLTR
jgi:hypothetical protein